MKAVVASLIAGPIAALLYIWVSYPIDFRDPPPLADLQVTEGYMGFMAGRNEPTLTIGGQTFVCYFSSSRGPFGTCLIEYRNAPIAKVRALWYWHKQKWPADQIGVLMQVTTADGRKVLDYATQATKLREAAAPDGQPTLLSLSLRACLMLLGVSLATYFFFRKGAK